MQYVTSQMVCISAVKGRAGRVEIRGMKGFKRKKALVLYVMVIGKRGWLTRPFRIVRMTWCAFSGGRRRWRRSRQAGKQASKRGKNEKKEEEVLTVCKCFRYLPNYY